jgi:hypothetical protein
VGFGTHPGVEPTNNPAERALRGPVIHRKLSHGTRSDDGERFAQRALSAAATCRQQHRSLFDYLSELLAAHTRRDPLPALTSRPGLNGYKNDLLCRAFTAVLGSRGLRQEVTFMVQDAKPVGLDGTRVCFDDERAVCDAGAMLVATLAQRLGVETLAQDGVRLRRDRAGAANAGRKVMALVYAMVLGADSIEDCDILRAGRTGRLLGGWIAAPSTLGTFLRAFTFGHVRQLDWLLGRSVERAWQAGAGPGDGRLVVDVDSFVGEVCGRLTRGAAYGYTKLLLIATR